MGSNAETIQAAINTILHTPGWNKPCNPTCLRCRALAALEEMERDERRLDWIEKEVDKYRYHADFAIQQDEEDGVWFSRITRHLTGELPRGIPYEFVKSESVRAAIDAAMQPPEAPAPATLAARSATIAEWIGDAPAKRPGDVPESCDPITVDPAWCTTGYRCSACCDTGKIPGTDDPCRYCGGKDAR